MLNEKDILSNSNVKFIKPPEVATGVHLSTEGRNFCQKVFFMMLLSMDLQLVY